MRFIILIVIVCIALVAGFFTLKLATPPEEVQQVVTEEPKVEAVDVMVARTPIPVGTTITEEMVDRQPWPKHLLLNGFVDGTDPNFNVVGMVARSDIQQQEPFIKYKLANPNDANFIAAALPAGMRAVTVSVDAISGVAGYIFPGDRIDITFVHNIPGELQENRGMASNAPRFSETLLKDVPVLAVDLNGEAEARRKRAAANPDAVPEAAAPRNITLAMSNEDVQKLRLAEKDGVLSLALRSLKDRGVESETQVTSLRLLTTAEIEESRPGKRDESVTIIRGVNAVNNIVQPPQSMPTNPNGM